MRQFLLFFILISTIWGVQAHEIRPAYLKISEQNNLQQNSNVNNTYDILWRVPTGTKIPLSLTVDLPKHCITIGEKLNWKDGRTKISKWIIRCPGGLAQQTIQIGDLNASMTDVLARYERADGTSQIERLTPTQTSFVVHDSDKWYQVIQSYTALGIEHILFGVDHLLFVLTLIILISGFKKLLLTITTFTVAHSISLAAASLGWVTIPQQPVEAIIALSILFVAVEIVYWYRGQSSLTQQYPWMMIFPFGLIHGLGFAGALSEIGLPEHAIPLSLLFFNIGVEIGQFLFMITVLAIIWGLRKISWPTWAWAIPVYPIGSVAAFWTIERIFAFIY